MATPVQKRFSQTRYIRRDGGASPNDLLGTGPTFKDLVLGAPLRLGGPSEDGADLAEWLLGNHVDHGFDHIRLRDTLEKASFLRAAGLFLSVAGECRVLGALHRPDAPVFAASANLFVYYAAAMGDQEGARCVAAEATALAASDILPEDRRLSLRAAALGWLSFAALTDDPQPRDPRQYAREAAERTLDEMARNWRSGLGSRKSALATFPFEDQPEPLPWCADTDDAQGEEDVDVREPGHAVVFRTVGGRETPEGARIAKAYIGLIGQPLPLIRTPDCVFR